MSKEIWKDVPGYEGYYQASNLGRIRSLDRTVRYNDGRKRFIGGRISSGSMHRGYRQTSLSINGKVKTLKFSQIIAMTFLNHIPNGITLVVDHINGDKTNDKLDNLRVVTNRENCSVCYQSNSDSFTSKYLGVYWHKDNSKWVSSITYNACIVNLGSFSSEIEASNAYQLAFKKIKNNKFNPDDYKRKFTSKYNCVSFDKKRRKWIAYIKVNRQNIHLGSFNTEHEAAQAYNNYVIKHKLNRKLNIIKETSQ